MCKAVVHIVGVTGGVGGSAGAAGTSFCLSICVRFKRATVLVCRVQSTQVISTIISIVIIIGGAAGGVVFLHAIITVASGSTVVGSRCGRRGSGDVIAGRLIAAGITIAAVIVTNTAGRVRIRMVVGGLIIDVVGLISEGAATGSGLRSGSLDRSDVLTIGGSAGNIIVIIIVVILVIIDADEFVARGSFLLLSDASGELGEQTWRRREENQRQHTIRDD